MCQISLSVQAKGVGEGFFFRSLRFVRTGRPVKQTSLIEASDFAQNNLTTYCSIRGLGHRILSLKFASRMYDMERMLSVRKGGGLDPRLTSLL